MSIPKAKLDQIFADPEFLGLGDSEKESLLSAIDSKGQQNESQTTKVEQPSLLGEFGKANEQVAGGIRNTFLRGNFNQGFSNPKVVEKFSDTYPQAYMNLLEKSKFLREHPGVEQTLFQTPGMFLKAGGIAADIATEPLGVAGSIIGNRLAPLATKGLIAGEEAIGQGLSSLGQRMGFKSALGSSKAISKINRAESVFAQRAADIESRAGKAETSIAQTLKSEKDAVTNQIKNTTQIAKEAKGAEIAAVENDYGKKLLDTHDKITKTEKGIPWAAQRDANSIKKEIPQWMRNSSKRWNDEVDAALGGSDADIFINNESVVDELSSLLRSRGIEVEGGVATSLSGNMNAAEKKIVDVVNRISNSNSPVSVRSLIKDSNYFGKNVKYGKVFGNEQALLDDAKGIVAGQAEDIIPALKDTKAWYGEYAQTRNRAFESLDPFGGKFSKKGTQFFEKLSSGKAQPEDFQFLDELEKSLGKQSGKESFELSREQNLLKGFEEKLKSMKAEDISKIETSLDKETKRLENILETESVSLENKAGGLIKEVREQAAPQVKRLTEQANQARIRLSRIKRIGTILKWTARGSAIAGGGFLLRGARR